MKYFDGTKISDFCCAQESMILDNSNEWQHTEIPDNLVTFSSVISVYTFPFFSN